MRHEYIKGNEEIFKIGSIGEKFYIILSGAVSVHIKPAMTGGST